MHPACLANIATRNQAPRSHTSQGKKGGLTYQPSQPHCLPPACLGLPKSAKRVKILMGLVPSCQTADVMRGWAVSAATTRI